MKIKKEHLFGVILGLVTIIVIRNIVNYNSLDNTIEAVEKHFPMPTTGFSYEPSLDDIRFVELQIEAVTIDMYRYIDWFPEKKELIKKASVKAIADLELIKDYLQELDFTGQLVELKKSDLTITDKLIQIYDGIELKQDEDIEKSFIELDSLYSGYSKKLGEVIKEHEPVAKLPEDFDPNKEELKFAQNQQDRQVYLDAVEHIKEQRFGKAYNILVSLRGKYKNTIFESCVTFRLSDCLFTTEPDEQGKTLFDPDKAFDLLSDILESKEYSPVFFDAFYEWRTQYQIFWGGMSNMSAIHNWKYNLKRWQAAQTIKQYLKTNPDDLWAKAQFSLLLNLPNIGRGGSLGNDNLSDWGSLYLDNNSNGE